MTLESSSIIESISIFPLETLYLQCSDWSDWKDQDKTWSDFKFKTKTDFLISLPFSTVLYPRLCEVDQTIAVLNQTDSWYYSN